MNILRMQSVLRALLTRTWTMDELTEAYRLKSMGRPYGEIAERLDRTVAEVRTAIHEAPR